ncbi:Nucleotide-binding, alpha-beta plait [Artemisia annua]|uniref:Nucleotide-binding, alpha-beta plait n=1 Tax=Artemisia annua TaxID=35608 RepID=A0A2U1LP69_ARTAN|nr:Nucleotide-binding, alpha-beta plait [Artemisia annua]
MHVVEVFAYCLAFYVLSVSAYLLFVLADESFTPFKKVCSLISDNRGSWVHESLQKVSEGTWKLMCFFLALVSCGTGTQLSPQPSKSVSSTVMALTVVGTFMFGIAQLRFNDGEFMIFAFIGNICYISIILISSLYDIIIGDWEILLIFASSMYLLILIGLKWVILQDGFQVGATVGNTSSNTADNNGYQVFAIGNASSVPVSNADDDKRLQDFGKDGFQVVGTVGLGYFALSGNWAKEVHDYPHTLTYMAICNVLMFLCLFSSRFLQRGLLSRIFLFTGLVGFHSMMIIAVVFAISVGYEPIIIFTTFLCLAIFERALICRVCEILGDLIVIVFETLELHHLGKQEVLKILEIFVVIVLYICDTVLAWADGFLKNKPVLALVLILVKGVFTHFYGRVSGVVLINISYHQTFAPPRRLQHITIFTFWIFTFWLSAFVLLISFSLVKEFMGMGFKSILSVVIELFVGLAFGRCATVMVVKDEYVNTWFSEQDHQRFLREMELIGGNYGGRMIKDYSIHVTLRNGVPIRRAQREIQKTLPSAGVDSTGRPIDDADSRTIFVSNVHFAATKDSLSRHFNKFGDVLKVFIVTDAATGQPKGLAYLEFMTTEAAENALSLDGTSFMSRILKVVRKSSAQQEAAPVTTS